MVIEQRTAALPAIPQARLHDHQHPLVWWVATVATVLAAAIAIVAVSASAVVLSYL